MKRVPLLVLAVILLASVLGKGESSGGQNPQWKGSIVKEGDVTVVRNPKEPLFKETIISFKEEISIGGAAARGDDFLAVVRSLAVDDGGTIYILDEKDIVIKVFDKDGKFIRKFGQAGQGPGDLNNPSRIVLDRFQKAIMVINGAMGLSFFRFDGKFVKSFATEDSKRAQLSRTDSRGNIILNSIKIQDSDHRWDILKKFDLNAASSMEIKVIPLGSPYDPLMPMVFWDIDDNDNIYFGFPKDYGIEIISARNQVVRKIVRDFTPVEPNSDVKSRIAQMLKRLPSDIASKLIISRYHSAFANFMIDDQGWLFVANWEKVGKDYVYDVFDPEGRYIAKFIPPYKSIIIKKEKLYTSEEDEDGYQIVKRYAMTWLKK